MSIVSVIADIPVISRNYECPECGLKLGIMLPVLNSNAPLLCPDDETEMLLQSSEEGLAAFSKTGKQLFDSGNYTYAWQ